MRMAGKHPLGWVFAVDPPESRKLDSMQQLGKLRRFPATPPPELLRVFILAPLPNDVLTISFGPTDAARVIRVRSPPPLLDPRFWPKEDFWAIAIGMVPLHGRVLVKT